MHTGIIRYPGSNCDFDALRYFENSFFIWHTENELPNRPMDLLVIPGGFAFGDRDYSEATGKYKIDPGKKALESPVSDLILKAYNKGITILGICNGFQILTKMGLLPGGLVENKDKKFHSYPLNCVFEDGSNYDIPIANNHGIYYHEKIDNKQVFLRYHNDNTIAGVCDRKRKVFGMMPHPERLPNNKELKEKLFKIIFSKVRESSIAKIMESEHVSYKSTKKFLKNLYTSGFHVIQGPGENAGIIDIGNGYALCLRIESHNHPIFINPFQGAATGVGGILRDIFTMGARPIALFDFLRFGTNDRAKIIEEQTIKGISYYGNCVGVPVVGGDYYVDEVYNNNPLLNVGCIGLVKTENIIYGHAPNKDRYIIYIGAKTGAEGIGGADMASQQFSSDNIEGLEDNIQTGDPYLEKLLLEVCCELAEKKLVEGMQDMGAGGLLCSSLELVIRGRKKSAANLGCQIMIDKVPVKDNLSPTDTLISESQERMLLISTVDNSNQIINICRKWDLECQIIGKVTDDGSYTVSKNNMIIYEKAIDNFEEISQDWIRKDEDKYEKMLKEEQENNNMKWSVYDNTLGGRTIKGPLEDGSYAIMELFEVGKKLYITWGPDCPTCLEKLNRLDREMTHKTIVNCLNFGHPEDTIGAFEDYVNQLASDCEKYKIPVVGGNVSLYNCTDGKSIPSSPIIMMIGLSK